MTAPCLCCSSKPAVWLLASTALVREQTGLNAHGDRMVLLLSSREQVIQLLQQA